MIRLGVVVKYALVVLLVLLSANVGWLIFIIAVDLFCGVRPQTAVPVFPTVFIGLILLLMVRALRNISVTTAEDAKPIHYRSAGAAQVSDVKPQRSRKTTLRSMLIVNRKRVSSASEVKGKV